MRSPYRSMLRTLALILCLSIAPASAQGLGGVEVVGLFKARAIVRVGAAVHTLRVGDSTPEGVRLVAADSDSAVLAYQGQRVTVGLSNRMTANFTSPARREVAIPRDESGHYRIRGTINGLGADLLVDTGATMVTLSSDAARRLGIDWERSNQKGTFNTAMGVTEARIVRLAEVQVGAIAQNNVEAVVIEGSYPSMILLGMSFLGEVRLEDSDGVLRLSQ